MLWTHFCYLRAFSFAPRAGLLVGFHGRNAIVSKGHRRRLYFEYLEKNNTGYITPLRSSLYLEIVTTNAVAVTRVGSSWRHVKVEQVGWAR